MSAGASYERCCLMVFDVFFILSCISGLVMGGFG